MMELFDYIFYRIYKFYEGRKNELADTFASNLLSLLQFFTLLDVLAVIRLFFDFPIPHKVFIIPVIVVLVAINWYRYQRSSFDIKEFDEKWQGEELSEKKRNGRLIVLYMLCSILFPIALGILKHNLALI